MPFFMIYLLLVSALVSDQGKRAVWVSDPDASLRMVPQTPDLGEGCFSATFPAHGRASFLQARSVVTAKAGRFG
jgi:hypothetical protein